MLEGLPDSFKFEDGEIYWGRWSKDITCLFHTEGECPKPLVITREYSKGKVIWINSGDKKDFIAKSISLPEKEFITLLKNAIEWISTIN